MKKKQLIFIGVSLFILMLFITIPILLLLKNQHHNENQKSSSTPSPVIAIIKNGAYFLEDASLSPNSAAVVVHGEILRETKIDMGHTWQRFTLKNFTTGSTRILFEKQEEGEQIEKISTDNWSPTNRFLFVFIDLPDKRKNLLFFETDGRFTNAQYYLQPISLAPFETVVRATWRNEETLDFVISNSKNKSINKYEVDFNDSSGKVKQITP